MFQGNGCLENKMVFCNFFSANSTEAFFKSSTYIHLPVEARSKKEKYHQKLILQLQRKKNTQGQIQKFLFILLSTGVRNHIFSRICWWQNFYTNNKCNFLKTSLFQAILVAQKERFQETFNIIQLCCSWNY